MHNAVICTLSPCDVIGKTRHLHIKLKSFSNIAQPLYKEAVRGCSFLYSIAKKSVIMSEVFLVDVSIQCEITFQSYDCSNWHCKIKFLWKIVAQLLECLSVAGSSLTAGGVTILYP